MTHAESLHVRARLLSDPALWSWEITDRQGEIVASSWHSEWTAYPSRDEAVRAGHGARTSLARTRDGDDRRG